jgi:hypothetical protein
LVHAYVLYLDTSLLCFIALLIGFRVKQQAATFIHIKWLAHVDVLCLNTSLLCFTAMLLEFSYCYNKMITAMSIHIERRCLLYQYVGSITLLWTNHLSFFSDLSWLLMVHEGTLRHSKIGWETLKKNKEHT